VLALREPEGDGIRVDSGLSAGTEVGTSYDPMLAKVIAHGPDRPTALRRLRAALADTTVLGLDTNTGFLRRLLAHPSVTAGDLDTGLIDREVAGLVPSDVPAEVYAAAALLRQAALGPTGRRPGDTPPVGTAPGPETSGTSANAAVWVDPFSVPNGWRLGGAPAWTAHWLRAAGLEPVILHVRGRAEDAEVRIGDAAPVRAGLTEAADGRLTLEWDGVTHAFHRAGDWLGRDGDSWRVAGHDPVEALLRRGTGAAGVDTLAAPMPGTVTVVKVAVGDTVTAGQSLLVVEAMKMEHVITAPHDGTVAEVSVVPGATVAMDQVLAVIDPSDEPPAPANGADTRGSTDRGTP
jgi:acetyl-CoA/propionyl-CoA carboxylase biotin carboxyl carrier protein